jgi:nicotinamidase-related amidase
MLKPDETVFVLIDVQGKLAQVMHKKEDLFRNLQILIQGLQAIEIPVLWLEQYPEGLGPTIPEIAELLPNDAAIPKACFSACGKPEFRTRLQDSGRNQVLVAGIEAHICVYQTVRDLLDMGHEVEVVADAVSSRTPENRQVGLDRMASMGASITSVEMLLFELLGEAGSDVFRQVAKLVR